MDTKYQWLGKRKIKQKHRKTEIIKTQNVSVISIEKNTRFFIDKSGIHLDVIRKDG